MANEAGRLDPVEGGHHSHLGLGIFKKDFNSAKGRWRMRTATRELAVLFGTASQLLAPAGAQTLPLPMHDVSQYPYLVITYFRGFFLSLSLTIKLDAAQR